MKCVCVSVCVRMLLSACDGWSSGTLLSRRLLLNGTKEGLLKWICTPLKQRDANKRLDVIRRSAEVSSPKTDLTAALMDEKKSVLNCCCHACVEGSDCSTEQMDLNGSGYWW